MSTKERILEEALALFAEKGYDGTGVDQIAESVGIKGPSLYKHFKGKEDILNELIDSAEFRYEEYFGSERHIGKLTESKEEFVRMTMEKISFTMHDPIISKIRKFLVREQFRNQRIAEVTSAHQLDWIQRMYAKIIEGMMEKGIIINDDPYMLATELSSPIVLLISKSDRQPQCEKEILESIEKYIRHFCDVYMR